MESRQALKFKVLRARDFRLYLEGGKRLVDLWLDGGRAVLGHKPPGTVRELKNAAERGLFVSFPNVYEARFAKALAKMLRIEEPSNCKPTWFKIYSSKAALFNALEKHGIAFDDIADPAFSGEVPPPRPQVSFWRPFAEKNIDTPFLVPVLPWPLAPWVLVFSQPQPEKPPEDYPLPREAISQGETISQSEKISPVILAPATRAIHDLLAAEKTRGKFKFAKIEKALSNPDCKWRRRGIYLTYEAASAGFLHGSDAEKNWSDLRKRFFEAGFLIPPSAREPLILPGELSPGEETKLSLLAAGNIP